MNNKLWLVLVVCGLVLGGCGLPPQSQVLNTEKYISPTPTYFDPANPGTNQDYSQMSDEELLLELENLEEIDLQDLTILENELN